MKLRAPERKDPSGVAAGFTGTLVVHAAAVGFFLLQLHGPTPKPGPPVYAVNLVAAPAPTPQKRIATEAIPTPPPEPAPEPPKPAPEPPKPTAEKTVPLKPTKPKPEPPKPAPPSRKPPAAEPSREAPAPTQSAVEPVPGETPSTGTDVANVKTPGLAFPYPEYLRNIMNEVLRRFGQPDERLIAEVSFLIMRDGSVRDVRFVRRSGNFNFDLEAQGAIESAANARAFGPLPEGWESDVLPIVFAFEPR